MNESGEFNDGGEPDHAEEGHVKDTQRME